MGLGVEERVLLRSLQKKGISKENQSPNAEQAQTGEPEILPHDAAWWKEKERADGASSVTRKSGIAKRRKENSEKGIRISNIMRGNKTFLYGDGVENSTQEIGLGSFKTFGEWKARGISLNHQ